ncbi:hypothetical protein ACH3XW_35285 [Acanthocheilonema viteae]
MISEVLGLLLGQISVLSMRRFFKALPKPWIHKYVHPIILRFLRCDTPSADILYCNRTQSESTYVAFPPSICQHFQRFHTRMKIIIDSISRALLKLHNYDKQLIRFEETLIGSAIALIIIFGILLTVLLWLRRLSHTLPNSSPENNKRNEEEYNCWKQKKIYRERSASESSITAKFASNMANLGEEAKKLTEKSQSSSIEQREFNAGTNKETVLNMRSRQHQQSCNTELFNSVGNYNGCQIRRRTFNEVKRQRYVPIFLFFSDGSLDKDIFHSSVKLHPIKTAKRRKRRYKRIF